MEWANYLLSVATLIMGGGWIFTYRAYKKKNEGEATQAEAGGWKAQQDVYQGIIDDMKNYCENIKQSRDYLGAENKKLVEENIMLRKRYNELEDEIQKLKKEIARQGRKIESIYPFACATAMCSNRKKVEIQDQMITDESEI